LSRPSPERATGSDGSRARGVGVMAPQKAAAMQLELLGPMMQEAAQRRGSPEGVPVGNIPDLDGSEGSREICEVWAWNLEKEFNALIAAVAGEGVMLAFDMEFPGFVCTEARVGGISDRYQSLRQNVDSLRPIQFGAAVSSAEGVLRGCWSFNLRFDVDVDLHTEQSVAFLRAAGIDFPRHASEGIEAAVLGRLLSESLLVGEHGARTPSWVTFSGAYDLGYLLKLITLCQPLPEDLTSFDTVLAGYCPKRHELKDVLPHGSLESLARKHGVKRYGQAHTAGSDALLTLELFLCIHRKRAAAAKWNQWQEAWGDSDASSSYSMDGWYNWGADWPAPARWEDHYSPFLLQNMGPQWMHPGLLAGSAPGSYMGPGMQNHMLKATHPPSWPDAATAAALIKSGVWHSTESPTVSSQVLAI